MAALLSELVMFTLVPLCGMLTIFQLASTAFTVMPLEIAVPAVCAVGVPVLPEAVPGAAVSPGNRTCSLVTAPGLTVSSGLVLEGIAGVVTSDAVTV